MEKGLLKSRVSRNGIGWVKWSRAEREMEGEATRRRGDQASRGEESEGVVSLPGARAAEK